MLVLRIICERENQSVTVMSMSREWEGQLVHFRVMYKRRGYRKLMPITATRLAWVTVRCEGGKDFCRVFSWQRGGLRYFVVSWWCVACMGNPGLTQRDPWASFRFQAWEGQLVWRSHGARRRWERGAGVSWWWDGVYWRIKGYRWRCVLFLCGRIFYNLLYL